MQKKFIMVRMCILCKKRKNKNSLIRILNLNQTLLVDKKQKMEGRGFYICKDLDCLKKLEQNKIESKFKIKLPKDFISNLFNLDKL